MELDFTPLKDFDDAELRSRYLKGLNYRIRDQRGPIVEGKPTVIPAQETLLYKKLQRWLADGFVRLGTADGNTTGGAAKVRGRGQVS